MKTDAGGLGNTAMKYVVRSNGGNMRRVRVRHWYGLVATMAVRSKDHTIDVGVFQFQFAKCTSRAKLARAREGR